MYFREKHNILHKDRLEAQTRPDRQNERVSRYKLLLITRNNNNNNEKKD